MWLKSLRRFTLHCENWIKNPLKIERKSLETEELENYNKYNKAISVKTMERWVKGG